jgi:hypothetical protein
MRRTLALLGALAMAASTAPLAAQSAPDMPRRSTVLSIQPLSAIMAVYAVELEQSLGSTTTLGAGGTYWSPEFAGQDITYKSGDLKLRYYPQGRALEGFAFGMSAGYTTIKDRSKDIITGSGSTSEHTASGATLGASLEYNWLLGRNNGFYIGLGAGAKRILAKADQMSDDVKFSYPTARLSIGKAF